MNVSELFEQRELTRSERAFLRQLARWGQPLDTACSDLVVAVAEGDVEQGIRACRRVQSLGYLLGEAARTVERS